VELHHAEWSDSAETSTRGTLNLSKVKQIMAVEAEAYMTTLRMGRWSCRIAGPDGALVTGWQPCFSAVDRDRDFAAAMNSKSLRERSAANFFTSSTAEIGQFPPFSRGWLAGLGPDARRDLFQKI
jgi:hypothetical protein